MLRTTLLLSVSILVVAAVSAPATAQWEEERILYASDAANCLKFGWTLDLDGDTAVIGARNTGGRGGRAYLMDASNGGELYYLTSGENEDAFGYAGVAIEGDTVLVAANRWPGNYSGGVWVFDATTGEKGNRLTSSNYGTTDGEFNHFGIGLDIDGDNAIIGAHGWPNNGYEGMAYLFDIPTETETFPLTPSDPAGMDFYGRTVGISGGKAIVGAYGNDESVAVFDSGSAYVIDVATGTELRKLTADDATSTASFGYSVGVSGNIGIVGAHGDDAQTGAAYLFNMTTGKQLSKLTADDGAAGDQFGYSVAIDGNVAIVGAPFDDNDLGDDSGAAYLFDVSTGEQIQKLTASDGELGDQFGNSLAIDGNRALIGAWVDDHAREDAGTVYAFSLNAHRWDGADGDWDELIGDPQHSHWSPTSTDLPSSAVGAIIDAGICTVPDAYTAEAKTMEVGPDGTLIVNGTLTAEKLTTAEFSTFGGSGTIIGTEVMIGGIIAPGNSIGVLTLDASGGGSELADSAVYECEIGADDAPIANDVINVTAGDFALGGTLELVATSKLRGPDESGEWFGKQTRTITNAVGDNSIGYYFATPPTPLPEDFGSAEWGEGHIGRGVFLTRENNGGENDVPGVSYTVAGTDVHLFQAIDGDTNGNAILDTADIFSILGAGSFLKPGEWDWTEGDFDGDKDVDTTDIFAILATGKWGNFAPYYPEPGKGSAAKGDCDAVVDLIVNAATGEVSVDTNGAEITGYMISSDSGALTGSAATQFTLTEQTSGQIADMLPLGKGFAGVHDLGSVLAGDGGDLTLTYTLSGQAGVFTGNVKVVPEPCTLAMLLAAAMGLAVAALRGQKS